MYTHKNDLLLHSLRHFFTPDKITMILPILQGTSKISLRMLDWFITNYTKMNQTTIYLKSSNKYCIVHTDYKSQLKAYSKKQFDPFCRRDRIKFFFTPSEFIDTTVGQLNFFRWAIQNKIIQYLENNCIHIEKEMNSYYKKTKQTKKMLKNESKSLQKLNNISIVLTFE